MRFQNHADLPCYKFCKTKICVCIAVSKRILFLPRHNYAYYVEKIICNAPNLIWKLVTRKEFVRTNKFCFNYLRSGHFPPKCPSKHRCRKCHQPSPHFIALGHYYSTILKIYCVGEIALRLMRAHLSRLPFQISSASLHWHWMRLSIWFFLLLLFFALRMTIVL